MRPFRVHSYALKDDSQVIDERELPIDEYEFL